MAGRVAFEKWQGLGNDFVIVRRSSAVEIDAALVRRLCDRRRGIGADGVLVVGEAEPGRSGSMIVFNADGSRPEMCGNGLRCVAAVLSGGTAEGEIVIATDAGERRARVRWAGEDAAEVEVAMGSAEVGPDLEVSFEGRALSFTTVRVGNPHAVAFAEVERDRMAALGPLVERMVEGGTNVELARVLADRVIDLVVWERGVGLTDACGTGACAAAVAACRQGLAPFSVPIETRLPGGSLWVSVAESLEISMRGPAVRVFAGEYRDQ